MRKGLSPSIRGELWELKCGLCTSPQLMRFINDKTKVFYDHANTLHAWSVGFECDSSPRSVCDHTVASKHAPNDVNIQSDRHMLSPRGPELEEMTFFPAKSSRGNMTATWLITNTQRKVKNVGCLALRLSQRYSILYVMPLCYMGLLPLYINIKQHWCCWII